MPEAVLALARRAAEAVDGGAVVALARDLVRIRSVVEPGRSDEREAAAFLADHLRGLGLAPVVEEAAPGRPNVICDWAGARFAPGRDRTLMFEGHTDVVTEGDADAWAHPPFAGEVLDGRLLGRGSADMKGGVAAAVGALQAVLRTAPDLPGRLRLGLVADEEGMMLGIKDFIARGWADEVDGAVVCEPEELELCLFQKGAMRLRVDVRGRMAHGAMPYAGVSPIRPLVAFALAVERLEREEQARLGAHPFLGLPWLTPTILQAPARGEPQVNVMPAEASLTLDVRTVPGQDHAAVLARLRTEARALADATPGLSVEVALIESRPWTETPRGDPLVVALEAVYENVLGTPPRFGGVPGATDGTFLHARAGVPIVTVGPGDRTIPHQRDEFVRVADLVAAARLYAAAAVVYLSEPRAT